MPAESAAVSQPTADTSRDDQLTRPRAQRGRICLDWKVVAGLAVVGLGVWVVAPNLVGAVLPLLLLAACPLSMLFMMWGMHNTQGSGQQTSQEPDAGLTREEQIARLRTQQAALADRVGELEREESHPANNGRRR